MGDMELVEHPCSMRFPGVAAGGRASRSGYRFCCISTGWSVTQTRPHAAQEIWASCDTGKSLFVSALCQQQDRPFLWAAAALVPFGINKLLEEVGEIRKTPDRERCCAG